MKNRPAGPSSKDQRWDSVPRLAMTYGGIQLSQSQQDALSVANAVIFDGIITSLEEMATGSDVADIEIAQFLPESYLQLCNELFLRRLLVCVSNIGIRLVQRDCQLLSCVGEELALVTITHLAMVIIEQSGEATSFTDWLRALAIDQELIEAFVDNVESVAAAQDARSQVALASMAKHWFEPFLSDQPLHPYLSAEL